jgi:hypothetical protein
MGKMKEIWAETQHDDGQWDVWAFAQSLGRPDQRTVEQRVIDSLYITVCDALQDTEDPATLTLLKKLSDLCNKYYYWEVESANDAGNWRPVDAGA